MSEPIKDGGPAFSVSPHTSGMSLRDYFAASSLAMMTGQMLVAAAQDSAPLQDAVAKTAYQLADAMLKAREAK